MNHESLSIIQSRDLIKESHARCGALGTRRCSAVTRSHDSKGDNSSLRYSAANLVSCDTSVDGVPADEKSPPCRLRQDRTGRARCRQTRARYGPELSTDSCLTEHKNITAAIRAESI